MTSGLQTVMPSPCHRHRHAMLTSSYMYVHPGRTRHQTRRHSMSSFHAIHATHYLDKERMVEEAVSVFLEASELEYTRLTSYAEALSKLSHAVASATKRVSIDQVGIGVGSTNNTGARSQQQNGFVCGGGGDSRRRSCGYNHHTGDGINGILGDRITSAFQSSELPHAASNMFDQIEAVRDSHAFLLDSLDDVVVAINEEDAANEEGIGTNKTQTNTTGGTHVPPGERNHRKRHTAKQRKLLQMHSILKDHAELSQRVVKTVCSSGVGVPIIHSNGMLATEETNDDGTVTQHQNRIVALAALRASIAKAKKGCV